MPLKNSGPVSALRSSALWQEARAELSRASGPSGRVGMDLWRPSVQLDPVPVDFPWGGFGQSQWELAFLLWEGERNELVLLCCRFSGSILWLRWTNSRLRYQFLPFCHPFSTQHWPHLKWSLKRWGVPGGGQWNISESWGSLRSLSRETWSGKQSGIQRPEDFASGFKSVHCRVCRSTLPSLRMVRVSIQRCDFCHRELGRGHWEMPSSGYAGVDNHQGLQQNARLVRASQLPEDTRLTAHFHTHPPGGALCHALFLSCTHAKTHAGWHTPTLPCIYGAAHTDRRPCPFYTKSPRLLWAWLSHDCAVSSARKRLLWFFRLLPLCPCGSPGMTLLCQKSISALSLCFLVEDGVGAACK